MDDHQAHAEELMAVLSPSVKYALAVAAGVAPPSRLAFAFPPAALLLIGNNGGAGGNGNGNGNDNGSGSGGMGPSSSARLAAPPAGPIPSTLGLFNSPPAAAAAAALLITPPPPPPAPPPPPPPPPLQRPAPPSPLLPHAAAPHPKHVFQGTKHPTSECGLCGATTTGGGCWRRLWLLAQPPGAWLCGCNRCGLRFRHQKISPPKSGPLAPGPGWRNAPPPPRMRPAAPASAAQRQHQQRQHQAFGYGADAEEEDEEQEREHEGFESGGGAWPESEDEAVTAAWTLMGIASAYE